MIVKSYINRGNSFPVILEENGKTYFVKLRAGMSGNYALINEWIGNKLGRQLNINTQVPNWIELKSDIVMEPIHVEVRELIYKSLGLNIGFAYQNDAKEILGNQIQGICERKATEIFLFDLMMINIDRTTSNTNLMMVGDEMISLDYESSLLFQDSIHKTRLWESSSVLHCFKHNPLYREIDEDSITSFIRKTEKLSFEEVISDIPHSIISEEERRSFLAGITQKKNNQWFLRETMDALESIKVETKEEQKDRMKKNQEILIRNMKSN